MKRFISICAIIGAFIAGMIVPVNAFAEPTTDPLYVNSLRAGYDGYVYMEVSAYSLCSTNTYTIYLNEPGGKAIYANALSAFLSGKRVRVEIVNTASCTGWGSKVNSLYLVP